MTILFFGCYPLMLAIIIGISLYFGNQVHMKFAVVTEFIALALTMTIMHCEDEIAKIKDKVEIQTNSDENK